MLHLATAKGTVVDISEILATKLEQKGWSQHRLAAESGIGQPQISRILRRVSRSPDLETLRALARALNCATIDLLPDEDKRGYSRAA